MEVLNTRASADLQIRDMVPDLQTLAPGIDRLLSHREGESGAVSAWLMQRWSISARKGSFSSPGGAHLDDGEVAIGFRRYSGTAENFLSAARELRRQEAPPPDRQIAGMLAAMGAALVQARQGENDTRLRMRAYVDRLREWPADVTAKVLMEWPDRSKFWPAWAELRPLLEAAAAPRRTLIRDLESAAALLCPASKSTLPAFALKRL